MTITTDLTCPECDTPTLERIHRVFTDDGVIETWQCSLCGFAETI